MISKMKDLKSFRFESNFEIDGESIGFINSNFNLDIDRSSDENLKIKGLIKIPIVSTEVQFIKIDKDLYLDLGYYSGLLDLLLSSLASGDLDSLSYEFLPFLNPSKSKTQKQELAIKDKWMKFDEDSYEKIKEIILEFDKLSSGSGVEDAIPEIPEDAKEEITKKFFQLLSENKIYNIKELADEKIGSRLLYHYQVVLDKNRLTEFISEFIVLYQQYLPDSKNIHSLEKEKIKQNMDDSIKDLGDLSFDVWIGQKDNYLYKFRFSKEKIKEEIRSLVLEVNFSEINKPIEIKPPAEFTGMNEVLDKVLAGTKTIASKERDSTRKSNMDSIRYNMKRYYQKNNKYFQSDILPVSVPFGDIYYKYNYDYILPKDPGMGPCASYQWISNIYNAQKFCVYACLESGEIYAANEIGSRIVKKAPVTINECTSLFPSKTAKDCQAYCKDPESWNPPGDHCYCRSYDPGIFF